MAVAMIDKLPALKTQQNSSSEVQQQPTAVAQPSVSGIIVAVPAKVGEIGVVLGQVDEITTIINQIEKKVEKVKENFSSILTSVENKEAKDENKKLNEEIKDLSHKILEQLKQIKQELTADETGPNRNATDYRIKQAQHSTLSRKLKDVMEGYNQAQLEHRDKCKERIQKQLKYTGRVVTDEEVEQMLESADPKLFTQGLVDSQYRLVLGEVETRHRDILQLEENIQELHDMFYEMAMVVEEQGDLVNQIERNVDYSGEKIIQGQRRVASALDVHQTNIKTRTLVYCLGISCCASVAIVVIVIIVVSVIIPTVVNN